MDEMGKEVEEEEQSRKADCPKCLDDYYIQNTGKHYHHQFTFPYGRDRFIKTHEYI